MSRTSMLVVNWFDRWLRTRGGRIVAGLALALHGLAHAVFPLRGAGSRANGSAAKMIIEVAWIVAMTGFVAGGFGLAGARPLHRVWRLCVASAVAGSMVAFATMRSIDLIPGLVFDVLALGAFYRWVNIKGANHPVATIESPRWKRILSGATSALTVVLTAYIAASASLRAWHSRWGVNDDELALAFPGDAADRNPAFEANHAVTINVPPSEVWPWLIQIGQDRAGFYSYDALEDLFGLQIHNADRVHAEWQERAVGDLVRAAPPTWLGGRLGDAVGWKISHIDPERALVLQWWGAFVLQPLGDDRSRLFVRSKVSGPNAPVWGAALSFATFEPIHFVMERKMLLGIKARSETRTPPWPRVVPGNAIAGH